MNYEAVLNVFLGMLTLLGCALLVMFWIVLREERTIRPIYRPNGSQGDPNGNRAESTITSHPQNEQDENNRET